MRLCNCYDDAGGGVVDFEADSDDPEVDVDSDVVCFAEDSDAAGLLSVAVPAFESPALVSVEPPATFGA